MGFPLCRADPSTGLKLTHILQEAGLADAKTNGTTSKKRDLVKSTAAKMRDLILAQEPDTQIGSLSELAKLLGVGIVTVQQAARVLEHEGLLEVRRGPGGGYYGGRPDAAALERMVAAYLRVGGSDGYEALELMTLIDSELMPAAARCADASPRDELRALRGRIEGCAAGAERVRFEEDLHNVLFKMVRRPLTELLARVSMRYYSTGPIPNPYGGAGGLRAWQSWRYQVIDAVLTGDPERAHFEAMRHRRILLARIAEMQGGEGD